MPEKGYRQTPIVSLALTIAAVLVSCIWFFIQLLQWKKHGDDYMVVVANAVVTLLLWAILGFSYFLWRRHFRQETKRVNEKLTRTKPWMLVQTLRIQCQVFLGMYRLLAEEYPLGETKFPLRPSSWPSSSSLMPELWTREQLTMFSMHEQFGVFISICKNVMDQMGWKDRYIELFDVNENTRIQDLIRALESLDSLLEIQFMELGGAYVAG